MISKDDLKRFMSENNVILSVVAHSSGKEHYRLGQANEMPCTDIVTSLVGDANRISQLYNSIQDADLPRMWVQQNAVAYVLNPQQEHIIVLFGITSGNPVEDFRMAVKANQEICAIWQAQGKEA